MSTTLTLIGGPTALIDIDGFRILTDPTFDAPGEYPIPGGVLVKEIGPALGIEELPHIDLVTLSHAHHPDNLDGSGEEFARHHGRVVGSPMAHEQLYNVTGLESWESVTFMSSQGDEFIVTAVPARHGPVGCEEMTGIVTGFVIESAGKPTIYISGDNAALELVREIREKFPRIDIAVLFTGAARVGLFDNAPLTLTAEMAAEASQILGSEVIFPVHSEGWAHFSEDRALLTSVFAKVGLEQNLKLAVPGEPLTVA